MTTCWCEWSRPRRHAVHEHFAPVHPRLLQELYTLLEGHLFAGVATGAAEVVVTVTGAAAVVTRRVTRRGDSRRRRCGDGVVVEGILVQVLAVGSNAVEDVFNADGFQRLRASRVVVRAEVKKVG